MRNKQIYTSNDLLLKSFRASMESYKQIIGRYPFLNKPESFNEKIIHFKISNQCKSYSKYADKYLVREFVSEVIGDKYLVPLIGIFDSEQDLVSNLTSFPNNFVVKATHGSGWNYFCDKKELDVNDLKKNVRKWLKSNYYDIHYEVQYKDLKPRVIVEQFVVDKKGKTDDFKFECFNGEIRYVQQFSNRKIELQSNIYNHDWQPISFTLGYPPLEERVARPNNFEEMKMVVKKLAKDFPYVRVDLFNIDGKIYFGELTFTPSAGYRKFHPTEADYLLGEMFSLKKNITIKKKGVVYTCITGGYDVLKNHSFTNPEWDYICYTDNLGISNHLNSQWQLRPLEFAKLDNVRNQRWHKLHPHLLFKDYQYSIWVDANTDILNDTLFIDVEKQIKKNNIFSASKHPQRDCIFDEFQACKELFKDNFELMEKQLKRIKLTKMPEHVGLFETNILFRNHNNKQLIKLMKDWWYWISHFSYRDQLSLTYVLWNNKQKLCFLNKQSYRYLAADITFYPHSMQMRMDLLQQNQQILHLNDSVKKLSDINSYLEAKNKDLLTQFDSILNSKTFKAWQLFVKVRKKLLKK